MADGLMNAGSASSETQTSSSAAAKREQSTIGFPYTDLDNAIAVARTLLNSGGVPITRDQLAVAMNLAPGSGNFVVKIAAARLFGLVDFVQSRYHLTDLGHEILEPSRERAARVRAFYSVPLYKKTYEEFKGRQLPPRPHGLEQAFVKFGVSVKQKDKARLAFEKSASQAGFFSGGQDRLVEPIIGGAPPLGERANAEPEQKETEKARPTPSSQGEHHFFIEGLLSTLPPTGSEWPIEARKKWLLTAENIFDLIYSPGSHSEGGEKQ